MSAALLVPALLAGVSCFALARRQDVYGSLVSGASDGLKTLAAIVPALTLLLSAVSMLRASGALDALTRVFAPLLRRVGLPPELAPLILVRPISGSAALAVGAELIAAHGPDSHVGRTAAVMLGSTETTFYTISVYFGACGIRKTRYAVPAALIADCVGFLLSALTVRLFF